MSVGNVEDSAGERIAGPLCMLQPALVRILGRSRLGCEAALSAFVLPLQLLMETVGSDIRSCPLCQLGFPVGYPDDALIKHIDSHLENSKI